MCEIKEEFLKSTFTLVIWVFLFAFSSCPSFEFQEDVFPYHPAPAFPAVRSYRRNGKLVIKIRIQMPNISILM